MEGKCVSRRKEQPKVLNVAWVERRASPKNCVTRIIFSNLKAMSVHVVHYRSCPLGSSFLPGIGGLCCFRRKQGMPSRTRRSMLSFDPHAYQAFSSPFETVVLEAKHAWESKELSSFHRQLPGNLKGKAWDSEHRASLCTKV